MQDQILKIINSYSDVNVRSRIQQQFSLLKNIPYHAKMLYNKINITFQFDSKPYSFKLLHQSIAFEFVLKKAYPLAPLRVYLKSEVFQPYPNDCRDFLTQIINKEWHHSMTVYSVYQQIPNFLHRLAEYSNKPLSIQKLGKLHLGEVFMQEQLLNMKSIQLFHAFKLYEDTISMHCFGLSQTHIILFIPDKQPEITSSKLKIPQVTKLTLQFYAQVQSISELKISKQENSELTFTLKTYKQKKMVLQPVFMKFTYRIVKAKDFIKKILRTVTKFQSINMEYFTNRKDELTKLNDRIKIAEDNLARYLNKQNINNLNARYQSAVEYLSQKGNPLYFIYLNKIARMFLRQDVKLVSQIS